MKKRFLMIFIVIGVLLVSSMASAADFDIKELFTEQTIRDLSQGEKVNFSKWNRIVVSLSEMEINDIIIDKLLKNYLEANGELLPKNTKFHSAVFDTENATLNVAFLYGFLKIRCDTQVSIDTADENALSITEPKLKIWGIPIPRFITRLILKDMDSYRISYKEITGPDFPILINKIRFENKACLVEMEFPEEKAVDILKTLVPDKPVELLKDKNISDLVDLDQLSDIRFYISEDTVNRIFNDQLYAYIEGGDTVIPEGLQIKQVWVSLKDRLLKANINFHGFQMIVQMEFTPYCQDNVVGIDIGEMYLDGQQIPSALTDVFDEFTKNVRFDLAKAGLPSFIRLKGLNLLEKELEVNLSVDLLNREPVTIDRLEVLLGSGVHDPNAFFEYFAPTSALSDAVEKLLDIERIRLAVDRIITEAPIPKGLDLLINKDLVDVEDFSLDIADRSIRLTIKVWNLPMELKSKFSLTSEEGRVNLVFYDISQTLDGQGVPPHVMSQITGEGVVFTAAFHEISAFLCMDEIVVQKLALEDTGLVIRFHMDEA
jgi:hypothetical protein